MMNFHFLKKPNDVPPEVWSNLVHLYQDIGWYGVLTGSGIAFLAIYATRLGATPTQIGLINAIPALVIIFLALPAGMWLERRSIHRAVFFTSVLNRAGYLALFLLPWFVPTKFQVWSILGIILVMNIPGTPLQVGFNALFAASVPIEWRGLAAGIRNAVFAIATTMTSLVCGYILNIVRFPTGYQIIFGIGFIGAMLSSYHLWRIKPLEAEYDHTLKERNSKGLRERIHAMLRFDILRSPFKRTLAALVLFHFVQYLPVPLFPIYSVTYAEFSDQVISIANAFYYSAMFIGSLQLERLSRVRGTRWVTGFGMVILGFYPLILSMTHTAIIYYFVSIVGGLAWSLAGGTLFNYMLERVPGNDRPAHLAWFNLGANSAVLIGSLLGPAISEITGIIPALIIFAILRMAAGTAIIRWG